MNTTEINHIVDKCAEYQQRYIDNEQFMITYLKLPFYKRWFYGNKIIIKYLEETLNQYK
jgi:hypothetical protein